MRSLVVGVGALAIVAVAAGVGCGSGGTLTGAGGATLAGSGGTRLTGAGGSTLTGSGVGSGGVGPATGAAGSIVNPCNASLPAQPLPPDIMIVLDTSASMNDAADGSCTTACGAASKWSAAVTAIGAVLGSVGPPVNWGLKLMSRPGDACDPGGIDVATGMRSGSAIMTQLASRTSAGSLLVPGNRPTAAAVNVTAAHLTGAIQWSNPTIFLLTDGEPNCRPGAADPLSADTAGAVQAVADAAVWGVHTDVIGLGALGAGANDALSRMALAGLSARSGSPPYYPVTTANELADLMHRLVTAAAACTFWIPAPPSADGSLSRENIAVVVDGGAIAYDVENGWSYTDKTHTAFALRGRSCDAITSGAAHVVSVVYQCGGLP